MMSVPPWRESLFLSLNVKHGRAGKHYRLGSMQWQESKKTGFPAGVVGKEQLGPEALL